MAHEAKSHGVEYVKPVPPLPWENREIPRQERVPLDHRFREEREEIGTLQRLLDAGPVGIPADHLTALLAPLAGDVRVERLSGDARLWGKEVDDERYAVVAVP